MFRYLAALAVAGFLVLPAALISAPEAECATCRGATPCNACRSCTSCAHCAKRGGTCGVCRAPRR
jgi:hypothetical protein